MKRNIFSAITMAALLLTACSEIDNPPQPNNGKGIEFDIDLAQDWKAEKTSTRKTMRQQRPHAVAVEAKDGTQLWLNAYTTPGIKTESPTVETGETRGTPVTNDNRDAKMSDFSSFCYKSSDNSEYFANLKSTHDGILSSKRAWPVGQELKFFAVHPYDATAANFSGDGSTGISYNFKLNPNVKQQVDLMYASTGDLAFHTEEKAPLHFNHALTAVNFKMGDDFTFYGHVKKIALKNVYTSGTFTLPTGATTSEGATATGTWSNLGGRDVVVNDHEFDITTEHHGQLITTGDNVFLMIPQKLDDVVAEVTLDVSGEEITVSGSLAESQEWVAGTTRTYVISSQKDISGYVFNVSAASEVAFNAESMNIEVNSFFLKPDGSTEEVEWEVISREYSGGNGTNGWLGFPTNGTGSETHVTPINDNFVDKKAIRDNALRNATPRGTATAPWDLSTHDFNGNVTAQNTANCYVISAPGHYKLPLVYGNAIQNGSFTDSGYTTTNTTTNSALAIMQRFHNHRGYEITDPWLKNNYTAIQQGDFFAPQSASLVWSDISENILTDPHIDDAKEYLIFEVKAEDLTEHGNAVVAVKDGTPETVETVMWSWHLWFTTPDAVETTTLTNMTYTTSPVHPREFKIANENLGNKYERWLETDFNEERQVTITLQQKAAKTGEEKKTATFTVKQKPGRDIKMTSTYYQGGRKDAFPGYAIGSGKYYPSNSISTYSVITTSNITYKDAIQNPGKAYIPFNSSPPLDWCSTSYINTWAANQTPGNRDDVGAGGRHLKGVKTIYDPCPVGFQVPSLCTCNSPFSPKGIVGDHRLGNNPDYSPHVQLPWDNGWNFYTSAEETETVYFPALGHWEGKVAYPQQRGYYWHSTRSVQYRYTSMSFTKNAVTFGHATSLWGRHSMNVRPAKEEE